MSMYEHRHVKADGRELFLYGRRRPSVDILTNEPANELQSQVCFSHLRWHPLREEWVVYAAQRQARTFLPQAHECPLCVSGGGYLSEVPFEDFEVAVFENRFPAFSSQAEMPSVLHGIQVGAAKGRCEVIVYSPRHDAGMAMLDDERLALLIEVWGARVGAMRKMGLSSVLPFENRGEEIGVTLHHPHGQIYGFSFIPNQLQKSADAQARSPVIANLIDELDEGLIIQQSKKALSFVPPFAMYPYEIWIAPRHRVSSPEDLDAEQRMEMAQCLGDAMRRLDGLFGVPMPYILIVQCAPKGYEDSFHMTIEIRPFRRDAGKLKFLAGVEQGAGVFLVDVLPDVAAYKLREVV
tara:strand:+ start:125579 stop:126631 length:1053 start_codon:yes stop_codon:yes gene_type:complete